MLDDAFRPHISPTIWQRFPGYRAHSVTVKDDAPVSQHGAPAIACATWCGTRGRSSGCETNIIAHVADDRHASPHYFRTTGSHARLLSSCGVNRAVIVTTFIASHAGTLPARSRGRTRRR